MVVINSQNAHCYQDTDSGPFLRVLWRKSNASWAPINFMKSSRTEVLTVLPENKAGLCLTLVM